MTEYYMMEALEEDELENNYDYQAEEYHEDFMLDEFSCQEKLHDEGNLKKKKKNKRMKNFSEGDKKLLGTEVKKRSLIWDLTNKRHRNVNVISGSPKRSIEINNSTKASSLTISTPFFPIPYPRDYGIEHILTCESENCHVKLEFTDFQLGMISSMMVFDSNGQMLDSYNGDIFRPPIILSTGKSLLLQFRGNGVTAIGYKAEITFISDLEYNDKSMLPNTDCYIGSEFLCQNNHCLSIRLHCDGFDHCGDGSDEPESCEQQRSGIQSEQREWYSNKPNYYFPKIEQYPDLKTATGIFVMSTLGILVVLSGWMMILYRMGVRARHQRELQNQLQTISELLDRDRQDEQPDNPPDYEAPPDYEEVVKFGIGSESALKKNVQRNKKRHKRKINRDQRNQENHQNSEENHIISHSNENSITQPADQFQSLTSHIINTTGICETSNTSASSKKCEIDNTKIAIQTSMFSKATNTKSNFQSTSAYSSGTSTQFEENSAGFQDGSLNISFSLAIPKSNLKFTHKKQDILYYDNQHLKKAWVVFDNGQVQTLQNKRMRLRHTFSSPETFLHQICTSEDLNYGNVYSERDSFLSNATTFGSDLLSDHIPPPSTAGSNNNLKKEDDRLNATQFLKFGQSKVKNIQSLEINEGCLSSIHPSINSYTNYNDVQSDNDLDISCYDTVTLFSTNKKENNHFKGRKRGNRRSSSFTNCNRRTQIDYDGSLKRYSSVDLLIRGNSPHQFRTSSPPFDISFPRNYF